MDPRAADVQRSLFAPSVGFHIHGVFFGGDIHPAAELGQCLQYLLVGGPGGLACLGQVSFGHIKCRTGGYAAGGQFFLAVEHPLKIFDLLAGIRKLGLGCAILGAQGIQRVADSCQFGLGLGKLDAVAFRVELE